MTQQQQLVKPANTLIWFWAPQLQCNSLKKLKNECKNKSVFLMMRHKTMLAVKPFRWGKVKRYGYWKRMWAMDGLECGTWGPAKRDLCRQAIYYLVSNKEIYIWFIPPNLPFSQECQWYPSPVGMGPSMAGSFNDKMARNLGITVPVPEAVAVNLPSSATTRNNLGKTTIDKENGSSTKAKGFSLIQFLYIE